MLEQTKELEVFLQAFGEVATKEQAKYSEQECARILKNVNAKLKKLSQSTSADSVTLDRKLNLDDALEKLASIQALWAEFKIYTAKSTSEKNGTLLSEVKKLVGGAPPVFAMAGSPAISPRSEAATAPRSEAALAESTREPPLSAGRLGPCCQPT